MKIRCVFVSNSSSSSFILATAVIVDIKKVKDFLASVLDAGDHNCFSSVKLIDLKREEDNNCWLYEKSGNRINVEGFQSSVSLDELNGDEDVLVVNVTNNEGDTGVFSYDDEAGYIDYDISLDDLPSSWQEELYKGITENNGFAKIDKHFGAGRNG